MSDKVLDMREYYNFRKEVHKLYDNDTIHKGDLSCSILGIRDKYRCVNSVNIGIQDHFINVELDDDTSSKKKMEIANKIADSIGRFIVDNKDKLDPSIANSDNFNDLFIESDNHVYCDMVMIGDIIKFKL